MVFGGAHVHAHVHTCFPILDPSVVRVPYDALNIFLPLKTLMEIIKREKVFFHVFSLGYQLPISIFL